MTSELKRLWGMRKGAMQRHTYYNNLCVQCSELVYSFNISIIIVAAVLKIIQLKNVIIYLILLSCISFVLHCKFFISQTYIADGIARDIWPVTYRLLSHGVTTPKPFEFLLQSVRERREVDPRLPASWWSRLRPIPITSTSHSPLPQPRLQRQTLLAVNRL